MSNKDLRLKEKLLRVVSQYDDPYKRPPMDRLNFYFNEDELISLNNDGFEVWFGRSDRWYFFMKPHEFRSVIFWYLKTWVFKDFFGLRTLLYYRLLRWCLNDLKEMSKK